jgi:lipopolysaccharide/colanic/teichoic acid biosynthesis glycosyltransferase
VSLKEQLSYQNMPPPANARSPGTDSPRFVDEVTSRFLRDVVVERVDAERAALAAALAAEPHTKLLPATLHEALPEPMQPAEGALIEFPGWKRALDLALIALTCPIWLPLMLLVMAAIRISSPGPIFYRQERVGFRGRRFMIFKFRSMKVCTETSSHESHFERLMRGGVPMTKLDAADPRIIRWGRVLRATGLDELPQIFNVLRGDMSLVGPRPCTPVEFEKYDGWQRARVNAYPGLTGYWQVNGKNGTTFRQMIEMDLFYAEKSSIGLDLWIIIKTPAALLGQVLELAKRRALKLAKAKSDLQTVHANGPNGANGAGQV